MKRMIVTTGVAAVFATLPMLPAHATQPAAPHAGAPLLLAQGTSTPSGSQDDATTGSSRSGMSTPRTNRRDRDGSMPGTDGATTGQSYGSGSGSSSGSDHNRGSSAGGTGGATGGTGASGASAGGSGAGGPMTGSGNSR